MLESRDATVTGLHVRACVESVTPHAKDPFQMITVVAKLPVTPGKEEEVEAAFKTMVAAVKANEKGPVVTYSLHKSVNEPGVYLFYEQYESEDAIAAHGKSEHMAALNGALKGNLAGRPTIERYTKIAGIE